MNPHKDIDINKLYKRVLDLENRLEGHQMVKLVGVTCKPGMGPVHSYVSQPVNDIEHGQSP